jgi:7-keto-8-aminopelargonate synthetase-like enzyme
LGGFGAFAATSAAIADLLWNRARPFVFSTALPPSVPAAVQVAIEIVRGSDGAERRRNLDARATELRMELRGASDGAPLGFLAGGHPRSAIAPVIVGDDQRVMAISSALLEKRVFVQGIRPPTVAEGTARLRVSLCAGHSEADVRTIAAAIVDAMGRFT